MIGVGSIIPPEVRLQQILDILRILQIILGLDYLQVWVAGLCVWQAKETFAPKRASEIIRQPTARMATEQPGALTKSAVIAEKIAEKSAARAAEAAEKAAAKREIAAEKRAEAKQARADHKAIIQAIKNFEFPSDDEGFYRAIASITGDYSTCSVSPILDRDYKMAYKKRIEEELKVLKVSNTERHEKLLEAYNDAIDEMKKKRKKRLIIGGVIGVVLIIVCVPAMAIASKGDSSLMIMGILEGVMSGFWALCIAILVGRPKRLDE